MQWKNLCSDVPWGPPYFRATVLRLSSLDTGFNSIAVLWVELGQTLPNWGEWGITWGLSLKQKCCHFDDFFYHWLHRNLSFVQLSVQPVLQISKWRHFRLMLHGSSYFFTTETITKCLNPLRPRKNGRHFADDTLNRIFLNETVRISIKISLKFVPQGPINNNSALVQIMAWRLPGDKPLSEPMMLCLPTHTCVTRPQWVKKRTPDVDPILCRDMASRGRNELLDVKSIDLKHLDILPLSYSCPVAI